ncbi:MAG: hypothetical protein ABIO63_12230 [Casimicrobiaceae bacterium]
MADRRNRRHLWLVLATLVVVGVLATAKGLIGFYLVGQKALTFEFALAIAAVVAAVLAVSQKRIEHALEARFARNTHQHRLALAALTDELAAVEDARQLENALVVRFDALFATHGSALYRHQPEGDFRRVAAHASRFPDRVPVTDVVIQQMLSTHLPVEADELASLVNAPMVWPLRIRGQLQGFFVAGEHDYIESFDREEIDGVTELANAVATTLALLDAESGRR